MPNIFDPTSRIEETGKGIKFYEQDILPCSYVFNGNQVIDLRVDYLFSGFGVVLAEDNGHSFTEADHIYLLKIGSNDFQVFEKRTSGLITQPASSCDIAPSRDNKNMHLQFELKDKELLLRRVYDDGSKPEVLGKYKMVNECGAYRIGFYSNAGNTIRHVSFLQNVPENWNINIANTCGGRIHFAHDKAYIENCRNKAELEQDEITLKPGKYYLHYGHGKVNDKDDIQCVLFPSKAPKGDKDMEDDYKNILQPDGSFVIDSSVSSVDLKFKGTNGWISDVCITDDADSSFVETKGKIATMNGSYVTVKLAGLQEVKWTGCIYTVPEWNNFADKCPYAVLEVGKSGRRLSLREADVQLKKEYGFDLHIHDNVLHIMDADFKAIVKVVPVALGNAKSVNIFRNMTADIYTLLLKKDDNSTIDVLNQKTFRKYVPETLNSPIIVTDEKGESFDISASYREVSDKKMRLVDFRTDMPVQLQDDAPLFHQNIKVYGIYDDAEIKTGTTDIKEFASHYKLLKSPDYTITGHRMALSDTTKYTFPHIAVTYESTKAFHYIFTNWEREIFTSPSERIILEKKMVENDGDILVYGIRSDARIVDDCFYRIPEESMVNSIDFYADSYDIIPSTEYEIVFSGNEIKLNDKVKSAYKQIVVDYLKADSYCINYKDELGGYEVDISTERDKSFMNYNSREDGTVYEYKRTDIHADKNKYIILRRDEG